MVITEFKVDFFHDYKRQHCCLRAHSLSALVFYRLALTHGIGWLAMFEMSFRRASGSIDSTHASMHLLKMCSPCSTQKMICEVSFSFSQLKLSLSVCRVLRNRSHRSSARLRRSRGDHPPGELANDADAVRNGAGDAVASAAS